MPFLCDSCRMHAWQLCNKPGKKSRLVEIFDGSSIKAGSSELHFLTIASRLKFWQFSAPPAVPQI